MDKFDAINYWEKICISCCLSDHVSKCDETFRRIVWRIMVLSKNVVEVNFGTLFGIYGQAINMINFG